MSAFNKILLAEHAQKLGFLTAPFEKMIRLVSILGFINEHDELKESLAIKGGTAINLIIFNLPRLSVDIDMDFTHSLTKDETSKQRDRISNLLELYMKAEGYIKHKKSKSTQILDSFIYSYNNNSGNSDNIKIEINYSLRSHVLTYALADLQNFGIVESFSTRTVNPIEIFACKIIALSSRAAARDLFDINNMISMNLFSSSELQLLLKCTVFYATATGQAEMQDFCFKRIEDVTWNKVKRELLPMIRNTEIFDLQTAKKNVTAFLSEFMTIDDDETTYLKRFSEGKYEPELLFSDTKIINRIVKHPMILWRQQAIHNKQDIKKVFTPLR